MKGLKTLSNRKQLFTFILTIYTYLFLEEIITVE